MNKPHQDDPEKPPSGIHRRQFLAYCTSAVLLTLSYRAFSVFGDQDVPPGASDRCPNTCQQCLGCVQATSVRG